MSFNFKIFKAKAIKKYNEKLSDEEIEKQLNVEDGYDKDNPISTGKRLFLSKIHFSGTKKHTGESFEYEKQFYPGVNLWVADNLKGKSTLFKVIKFALTGNSESFNKPQVKAWFELICLEFKIGENIFTTVLKLNDGALKKAQVFSTGLDQALSNEVGESHLLFESSTFIAYEDFIQTFFFGQFTYYSLKWTQKDSGKNKDALNIAGASWKTYYKTIYLESADSNTLAMAGQNELVFQMLLGLELTSPINKLKVKKDLLEFETAKLGGANSTQIRANVETTEQLNKELEQVNKQIHEIQSTKIDNQLEILLKAYADASEQALEKQKSINGYQRLVGQLTEDANSLRDKENSLQRDVKKYINEVNALSRKIIDLKEYIDLGVFFTNLDITSCPHCDHSITKERKVKEKETQACMLCNEPVHKHHVDTVVYEEKIKTMEADTDKFLNLINMVNSGIEQVRKEQTAKFNEIHRVDKEIEALKASNVLDERRKELEIQINSIRNGVSVNSKAYEDLIEKKGELLYRIKSLSNPSNNFDNTVALNKSRIELLNWAINELKEERRNRSKKITDRLVAIMLDELHAFGLKTFTNIEIDESFRLIYTQYGDAIQFKDIVEGEKLRVKLAFYLSLIQLDVEYNFGRHPRFLVIDSPAKEEGDKGYLEGLKEVLLHIEHKHSEHLQIFVGTAVRELKNATAKEKLVYLEPDTFLF